MLFIVKRKKSLEKKGRQHMKAAISQNFWTSWYYCCYINNRI